MPWRLYIHVLHTLWRLYNIINSSSLEVILRAEAVELAQAGDKCDFIGTLIVVPDVSQIQTSVTSAETSTRVKGGEGVDNDGVR